MEVEDCLQHEDSSTKIGIVYFQREKIIHHVMKSLWNITIHVVVNLASSVLFFKLHKWIGDYWTVTISNKGNAHY